MNVISETPKETPTTVFKGIINNREVNILCDTGASTSCIDKKLCHKLNIPTFNRQVNKKIKLANGVLATISESCKVQFKINTNFNEIYTVVADVLEIRHMI